ncbi:MAG: transcriptional repressor LexA [Clostridia bacterium]
MKSLSETQIKIYKYLQKELSSGVPPSVREICNATGLSSTSSVHSQLISLEKMGLIKRGTGKNRSITLTGSEGTSYVPILGTVTAGLPILAFENFEGYIPYQGKGEDNLFALKIKGTSMKDAGILDGDYIIAKKTNLASNGDIVVALIEDEATVKTFYIEESPNEKPIIRLHPENEDYEDIFAENIQILGKVVAQMRYY